MIILKWQMGHWSWWNSHIKLQSESRAKVERSQDSYGLARSLISSFHCSGMAVGSLIWYQVHAFPLILLALRQHFFGML